MSNTEERRGPGRPPKPREADPTAAGGNLGIQVGEAKLRQQEEAEAEDARRRETEIMNEQQAALDAVNAQQAYERQQAEEAKQRKAKAEKLVEVHLQRDYRPADAIGDDGKLLDNGGVGQKLSAGTTVSLPKSEAARALKLGIATATDRTFDD